MKTCTKCKINKLFVCFSKHRSTKDSFSLWCKECTSLYDKKYYLTHRTKITERSKKYRLNYKKKISTQKKDYYLKHRDLILKKSKNYRFANRKQILEYKNKYRLTHKELIAKGMRTYRLTHKKETNLRHLVRKKSDINYRLACNLRGRLYRAVKDGFKTGSAVSDLGCTIEALKLYLEQNFVSGMNWNNWGKTGWHIDHIKPLCSFDLEDRVQLLQACHYSNLQPMWAKDNLSKGKKLQHPI